VEPFRGLFPNTIASCCTQNHHILVIFTNKSSHPQIAEATSKTIHKGSLPYHSFLPRTYSSWKSYNTVSNRIQIKTEEEQEENSRSTHPEVQKHKSSDNVSKCQGRESKIYKLLNM
jgi:hypothetical protein